MKKVLFICLGNICRSPSAEAVFNSITKKKGVSDKFEVDSAGTSAYHQGEPADGRMRDHAIKRGFDLTSISRGLVDEDYKEFDYLVTMDEANYFNTKKMCPRDEYISKIVKMTDYCKIHAIEGVPDPYSGGDAGFELVLDILEDSCNEFYEAIKS